MSKSTRIVPGGRVLPAPEGFLGPEEIASVASGRRDFLRSAFLAASATLAAGAARAEFKGDPNILELPEHSKALGQPVAARPYGMPSKFESNLQRRESPGLTRVAASSVAFTPLQGLFGIITPSGLHFERHHQGWWDIDPSQAPADGDGHGGQSQGVHDGRPDAPALAVALSFPRVRREYRDGMGPGRGAHGAVLARHAVVLRIHGREAVHAPRRLRLRSQEGEVPACRGCRWLRDDAHDRHGQCAGRRDGGVCHERRNAAPRERLSAAPGRARRAGRFLGEMAAPHRSRRPALGAPRTSRSTTWT